MGIGKGRGIEHAFIGRYTSIGRDCLITKSVLEHSVALDGVRLEGVARLEDTILGRNTFVRSLSGNHHALRLMIGDNAEVLL